MKKWIVTINYCYNVKDFVVCVPVDARDEDESHELAKKKLIEKEGSHIWVNRIVSFEQ